MALKRQKQQLPRLRIPTEEPILLEETIPYFIRIG